MLPIEENVESQLKDKANLGKEDMYDPHIVELARDLLDGKDDFEQVPLESDEYLDETIELCFDDADQDLKEAIARQISDQVVAIQDTCDANSERVVDMTFVCENKPRKMSVAVIKGDGNCLFGCIAHQMFETKINCKQHIDMTTQLRAETVEFISANLELFKLDLADRFLDGNPGDSDEDYKCCLDKLAKKGTWGGYESIKAIKLINKLNILLVNEGEDCYFVDGFNLGYIRTIILGYRLSSSGKQKRDHYDSVVCIDPNDIFSIAEKIESLMNDSGNNELPSAMIDLTASRT